MATYQHGDKFTFGGGTWTVGVVPIEWFFGGHHDFRDVVAKSRITGECRVFTWEFMEDMEAQGLVKRVSHEVSMKVFRSPGFAPELPSPGDKP
jgi:hypothetical protein